MHFPGTSSQWLWNAHVDISPQTHLLYISWRPFALLTALIVHIQVQHSPLSRQPVINTSQYGNLVYYNGGTHHTETTAVLGMLGMYDVRAGSNDSQKSYV